jgi:hypothetical protein
MPTFSIFKNLKKIRRVAPKQKLGLLKLLQRTLGEFVFFYFLNLYLRNLEKLLKNTFF